MRISPTNPPWPIVSASISAETKTEIIVLAPTATDGVAPPRAHARGYPDSLAAIAALVRQAEAEPATQATVGVGIPGTISPATGPVKNANSNALNGHAFDQDLITRPQARGPRRQRCQLLCAVGSGGWRGRRCGDCVRGDPRHRLRRRHCGAQTHSRGKASRRGRVRPHAAALAAARRDAAAALLVRAGRVPGAVSGRGLALAAECDGEGARDATQIVARAAAGDARARAALSLHARTGWRGRWR